MIGVWLASVIAMVLMAPVAIISADPSSPNGGGSVEISAAITPVRIVVVSDDRIVEILSNGPGNVAPSVHRGSPEGPTVAMTGRTAAQYAAIMHHVDQHKTGIIYRRQDNLQTVRLFMPSRSVMLTGLRAGPRL